MIMELVGMYRWVPAQIRSLKIITALLAILKAGGANVPPDPLYLNERLQSAVDNIVIQSIIVDSDSQAILPKSIKQINFIQTAVIESHPFENPSYESKAADLTYIIFTYGLTGAPRGVATSPD